MNNTSHMKYVKTWGNYITYRLEGVTVKAINQRKEGSYGNYVLGSDGNHYGSIHISNLGYEIGDTIYIDRPTNPHSSYYNKPHLSKNLSK